MEGKSLDVVVGIGCKMIFGDNFNFLGSTRVLI